MLKGIERSEEHTSELQSRETISYAVFCLNIPLFDFFRFRLQISKLRNHYVRPVSYTHLYPDPVSGLSSAPTFPDCPK